MSKEIAQHIKQTANDLGWNIIVEGSILTITKEITQNDKSDFCVADSECYSILELLPVTRPGSI